MAAGCGESSDVRAADEGVEVGVTLANALQDRDELSC
jgi:hypothetical protein